METNTIKKSKIEAIYPLTGIQRSLLFHHLMQGEDQGYLVVQCDIEGSLDANFLKQAWKAATQRHEIMRTSVHWKKIETPVLLVRPEKEIQWNFIDWTDKKPEEYEDLLKQYKQEQKRKGVNLDKSPLSKISIIKKNEGNFYFLWECHHLLLDGWSSTIILKDAFEYYKEFSSGRTAQLSSVPSLKAYKNWLKNQPVDDAKMFWKQTLGDFNTSSFFQENNVHTPNRASKVFKNQFDKETAAALKDLAKSYRVTLNTLFQGIWSLILAKYFERYDVAFGTTVSGRSISFPNIEQMAGMFANVIPVRSNFEAFKSFGSALRALQKQQQIARNYEYFNTDQIVSWAELPGEVSLFDSLFVFENFPLEDITSGEIKIANFESGITTTYPLTTVFIIKEYIEYELLVDPDVIPIAMAEWISSSIHSIAVALLQADNDIVSDLVKQIPDVPNAKKKKQKDSLPKNNFRDKNYSEYVPPKNKVELQLLRIWEIVLGNSTISTNDNFFEIGGRSVQAVRIFSLIHNEMSIKLPPSVLLEHPTIKGIAKFINEDQKIESWNNIVPLRSKGQKKPLFCIHAGGGHVFFYKGFADYMKVDCPIYAIQPSGLYENDEVHHSVEEMTKAYLDQIKVIQPEGPYNILVYCFSTSIGNQMAYELDKLGEKINLIVIDTVVSAWNPTGEELVKVRMNSFKKRLFKHPFKTINTYLKARNYFVKPLFVMMFGENKDKNLVRLTKHLVQLSIAYKQAQHHGNISLLLTQKTDSRFNDFTTESWKNITQGQVNVYDVEGEHFNLLEEPHIKQVARVVDRVMIL